MASRRKYKIIDLFAGAGGLTLGFRQAFANRLKVVWANDYDRDAAATYNRNFGPHCSHGDILALLDDPRVKIPPADVVMGGPPCQGFSLLNRNRTADPRKEMWRPFMEVVRRSGAGVFLIENVPQFLDSPEHEAVTREAEALGFLVASGAKLNAADFGVPQTRRRAFLIGCRFADPGEYFPPTPTHYNPDHGPQRRLFDGTGRGPKSAPWRTVRDAIGDLPAPEGTEIRAEAGPLDLHFGRNPTPESLRRYMAVPDEGMNRFDLQRLAPELTPGCWIRKTSGGTDLFGRLWWNRPAFTIRTEFFKPEKGRYLHPQQHRPITHREAARLQTFPDDFAFCGSKIEVAKQIGNAVPPALAEAVARSVLALLQAHDPADRARERAQEPPPHARTVHA